ncbi:MAG TPA: tetratricopeptide repeat protein [Pirellulales bacterium]|nr:tetratricopeptide repeat protein [Pirellulales bacterium]
MHESVAKLCVVLALVAAGCRSQARAPSDPFAARLPNPAATAQNGAPAGNSPVKPASYEQPQFVPPPGKSIIGLIPEEEKEASVDEKSAWEKTLDTIKPSNVNKRIKRALGRGPDEAVAKAAFDKGEELFEQRKFDEAAKPFKEAAARWPDSGLEEDAMFYLGECYFFTDRYYAASDKYVELLKKYENSRYLNDVVKRQFAIARYWEQTAKDHKWYALNLTDKTRPYLDPEGNAKAVYSHIHLADSQGDLTDDAVMAMASYCFRHNRFEEAASYYDELIKNFVNSEHLLTAHLLSIRAKLRAYQGPQYEASPLNDAEAQIEKTLNTFPPEQLKDERQRLLQAREAIRFERGQRVFQAGEYYYKIKYYRSARHYYENVLRDFPDTAFDQMAKDRLEETKDLPAVPHDYFKWLTELLPAAEHGVR